EDQEVGDEVAGEVGDGEVADRDLASEQKILGFIIIDIVIYNNKTALVVAAVDVDRVAADVEEVAAVELDAVALVGEAELVSQGAAAMAVAEQDGGAAQAVYDEVGGAVGVEVGRGEVRVFEREVGDQHGLVRSEVLARAAAQEAEGGVAVE